MMDFSSIIDLNQVGLIDFENYPLRSSKFFETKGSLEIAPAKKTSMKSIKKDDAKIIVILHENHETYFSAHPDEFRAFHLEPHS